MVQILQQLPPGQGRPEMVLQPPRLQGGRQEAGLELGFRKQGRPRQRKPAAVGTGTSVEVEGVEMSLQPLVQFYVGNTPGKSTDEVTKKVLEKYSEPLLQDAGLAGPLQIETVELLTKETNPRTKCWRIVVPHRFKEILEDGSLYPAEWRFRQFFGPSNSERKNRDSRMGSQENRMTDLARRQQQTQEESGQQQLLQGGGRITA